MFRPLTDSDRAYYPFVPQVPALISQKLDTHGDIDVTLICTATMVYRVFQVLGRSWIETTAIATGLRSTEPFV